MYLLKKIKHEISSNIVNRKKISGDNKIDYEFSENGCVVIRNFLSKEKCKKLIELGSKAINENPDNVRYESNNSDLRIYSVDTIDKNFELEKESDDLNKWAKNFYRTNNVKFFQMLGHIISTEKNLGSGGGWHRDSPFQHQFKFILYLSDVDENNGPFQYVKTTHREEVIYNYCKKHGYALDKYRFSDEEVAKICSDFNEDQIKTITGDAGTLLIADVKGLHRGKPLLNGDRWATTRYYYKKRIPEHLLK